MDVVHLVDVICERLVAQAGGVLFGERPRMGRSKSAIMPTTRMGLPHATTECISSPWSNSWVIRPIPLLICTPWTFIWPATHQTPQPLHPPSIGDAAGWAACAQGADGHTSTVDQPEYVLHGWGGTPTKTPTRPDTRQAELQSVLKSVLTISTRFAPDLASRLTQRFTTGEDVDAAVATKRSRRMPSAMEVTANGDETDIVGPNAEPSQQPSSVTLYQPGRSPRAGPLVWSTRPRETTRTIPHGHCCLSFWWGPPCPSG